MPKKFLLTTLLSLLGLTVAFSPAFAQDVTPTSAVTPTTTKVRPNNQVIKDAFKQQLQENKDEMKDLMAQRKLALQGKLATLKDLRKKSVVERINSKLATVNETRTGRMSDALARMTERISRVEELGEVQRSSGKDMAAFDQAVADAKDAISEAQAAVDTQKAKDYTLTLTTEPMLKVNVGQTVKTAQTDLRTTHATVVAAKKALVAAVRELAKLQGNSTMEDTETSSQSAI
jgi:hypothetical protein